MLASDRENKLARIIELVMTQHWDIKACECWLCEAGRSLGCRPREEHLEWRGQYAYMEPRNHD